MTTLLTVCYMLALYLCICIYFFAIGLISVIGRALSFCVGALCSSFDLRLCGTCSISFCSECSRLVFLGSTHLVDHGWIRSGSVRYK